MSPIQAREPSILEIADHRSPTLTIYDSDTDSSANIADDLDGFQDADDVEIVSHNRHRDPTPFLLNINAAASRQEIVDLTAGGAQSFGEGDYLTDEDFELVLQTWLLRTPSPTATVSAEEERAETRYLVQEACINGIVYKEGQSLELHDGSYLRICTVLKDCMEAVYFSGRRLIKARNHAGTYLPKERNELVWIANETEVIPFLLAKRFVIINFTSSCHVHADQQKLAKPNDLWCRLKETLEDGEVSIEFVSFAEADEGYKIESTVLRRSWRGETQAFGEAEHDRGRSPVILLDDADSLVDLTGLESMEERKRRRQYTFGDGFCGAGGVSCGARRAGLYNKWAFDNSEHATSTYRLNFEDTDCELSDIFSFLTNDDEFLKVDVSHGSPPCQTFSPAHTVESRHDDANFACIFSCSNLIRRAKPRVHTMEETSGLLDRYCDTFYRVINDFIEIGYSVRWGVLRAFEYGVPQTRKRLIVIASGPGEILPSFPRPSHGPGLKEYPTIYQAIANIPARALDHDIDAALSRGLSKPPYDPHQLARTITCGGGDNNYHPSGGRNYTNRELACLQTFPMTFKFGQYEVKKQIGNAVPPSLAEALYKEIVRSLQKTDEEELARNMGG
ncbi:DNA cytosine methyltransferase [Aspergillus alliaceus]|uniref:DNA cytosine methyltransferase n=1 Tax=Petromyces alliaceus TaxID=209559 RepID=UPI0012A54F81|nr:S-adenosyl-L-methionine-dependent methyltransferase [Aspergillus alliaceus]KAB8237681.1 S-adenosyl-L-methionine-dependent methyltransferase [Aspergillus alliaceus]